MRILITNNTLATRAGTELYVRDIARALRARGHEPAAYSTITGDVAEELRDAGITVVDDLDRMPWVPDIIHGHHHLETMTALTRFPEAPAVYFCHGWRSWQEVPPEHPRIICYVAVDEPTRDSMVSEHGIDPGAIRIILNFVDLDRFRPRGPLPATPGKALVFSNYATEDSFLPAVREACSRAGLSLDVIGLGAGRPLRNPADILGSYDIVFAIGRSALEAISVGAAVVVCGELGFGPMVTTANIRELRRLNFGSKSLTHGADPDQLLAQVMLYDADDAMETSAWLRSVVGIDSAVESILQVYRDVLGNAGHQQATAAEESAAVARYLRAASLLLKEKDSSLQSALHSVKQSEKARQALDRELATVNGSLSMRIRARILAVPVLGNAIRTAGSILKTLLR